MTAQDRGGASLVWIRNQITALFATRDPVDSVLEVTVKLDKKNPLPEVKGDNQDGDLNRDSVRRKVYKYISLNIKGNRLYTIGNQVVNIRYTEKASHYVHHITTEHWNDQIKAMYFKRLQRDLMTELNILFVNWVVSLNFLITKPLDYLPIAGEQSVEEEMLDETEEDRTVADV